MRFPGNSVGKESAYNAGDPSSIPGLGRSPGEGDRQPTPVFWYAGLENFMEGHKESDMTEQLSLSYINTYILCSKVYKQRGT